MQLRTSKAAHWARSQSEKPNIAIITHPFQERGSNLPIDNMVAVARPLANRLLLITGEGYTGSPRGTEIIKIKATRRTSFVSRALEQAVVHAKDVRLLLKLRGQIDILLFFSGTPFPVPLVFAQTLGMKCFIVLVGMGESASLMQAVKGRGGDRAFGELIRLYLSEAAERASYHFSDKLIVYSPAVIDLIGLAKHSRKIVVAREHFLNFEQYRFKDDLERRDNVVGFIGRLSEEKGVLNFVQAMPAVLSARSDVTFCLVGEGKLEGDIEAFIDKHALRSKVKLAGFIPHHKLPDYLTRLKLLVVPSYAEGLPNVVLEAMACGTPVLATPVGSVPDVIADKETGFLMRDNSPSSVAQSVVDTLACPDLRRIAVNARTLVEAEFRFEKIEETWKSLIWSAKDE